MNETINSQEGSTENEKTKSAIKFEKPSELSSLSGTNTRPEYNSTPISDSSVKSVHNLSPASDDVNVVIISEAQSNIVDLTTNNSIKRKRTINCCASHHKRSCQKKATSDTSSNEDASYVNLAEDDGYDIPCMKLSNIPSSWSYNKIKDFIESKCGPVLKIEFLKDRDLKFQGKISLTFDNCLEAMEKLQDREIDGQHLHVEMNTNENGVDDGFDTNTTEPPVKRSKSEEHCDNDIWNSDPNNLYGLNPSYLKNLGITPPLCNWVNVSNFRCGKGELKEVMELAGHVVVCCANIMPMKDRVAKVMYSHPLEAVQAISMLNGQVFFGEALKITMSMWPPNTILLPKGLLNVGPGLGIGEEPLRDVVQHYERYRNGKNSSINTRLFNPNAFNDDTDKVIDKKVQTAIEAIKELFKRGITAQHIQEALNELPEMKRTFKTICVDELKDIHEQQSKDSKVTNVDNQHSAAKSSFNKQTDVSGDSPKDKDYPERNNKPQNQESESEDQKSSEKLISDKISSTSSNSSERNISPISRPRNVRPVAPPKVLRPLSTPNTPSFRPSGPNVINSGPNFVNRGQNSNMNNRFYGPTNVPMGPRGPMHQSSPMGQLSGPVNYGLQFHSGQVGQMNNPMGPGPMPGPHQNASGFLPMGPPSGPMPIGPPGVDITSLEIMNLPPNTTFALLCDTLAKHGRVLSLQFTRAGCAVVQFADRMQATKCFQQLNKSFFLGNIIELRCL